MSALSAVEALLSETGTPLHYREITSRILERGLWKTEGKTPEATVNALLAVDIKKRGANSRFQRTGEGIFCVAHMGTAGFRLARRKARAIRRIAQETHVCSQSTLFHRCSRTSA